MTDTTKNNVPDGFILLQTQNGAPKYAACMTGRLAGWLMKKYPDGNWVSERKLTNLEVMQAEDQRDDGIVHETPAATIQEPVMVAEPMTLAGFFAEAKHLGCKIPADMAEQLAAPMVADPAGVAAEVRVVVSTDVRGDAIIVEVNARQGYKLTPLYSRKHCLNGTVIGTAIVPASVFAATVKAVPSEALDAAQADRDAAIKRALVFGLRARGYLTAGANLYKYGIELREMIEEFDFTRIVVVPGAAPLVDKTGGGAHG